jgi:hypothetical protein
MKKLLVLVVAAMMSFGVMAEPVKEKACVQIKDPKTGKVTEQCKEIKKHKKLEVEDTKKK